MIKSDIAVNIKSDGMIDCAERDNPRITPCRISAENSKTATAIVTAAAVKIVFFNFSVKFTIKFTAHLVEYMPCFKNEYTHPLIK
jgi:hypothetical protein